MKLTIDTPVYNEKRYGKPYIGVLSTLDGRVVQWGTWVGTPGEEGFLELEVEAGCAIIHGQKDNRGNNSTTRYAVVQEDGTLEYMSKAAAVKAARAAEGL